MACVGKHEGRGEPEAREGHIFRGQVAAYSGANGTQLLPLQRCVRFQWVEGLVRIQVRVFDNRGAPILPSAKQPKDRRGPRDGARHEEPDDDARRQLSEGDSGEAPRCLAKTFVSGKRGAKPAQWSLPKQHVERGGERRASLPQLFITLAQPLIRRQTRQEVGSAAFVELVVD